MRLVRMKFRLKGVKLAINCIVSIRKLDVISDQVQYITGFCANSIIDIMYDV